VARLRQPRPRPSSGWLYVAIPYLVVGLFSGLLGTVLTGIASADGSAFVIGGLFAGTSWVAYRLASWARRAEEAEARAWMAQLHVDIVTAGLLTDHEAMLYFARPWRWRWGFRRPYVFVANPHALPQYRRKITVSVDGVVEVHDRPSPPGRTPGASTLAAPPAPPLPASPASPAQAASTQPLDRTFRASAGQPRYTWRSGPEASTTVAALAVLLVFFIAWQVILGDELATGLPGVIVAALLALTASVVAFGAAVDSRSVAAWQATLAADLVAHDPSVSYADAVVLTHSPVTTRWLTRQVNFEPIASRSFYCERGGRGLRLWSRDGRNWEFERDEVAP